MKLNFNWKDLKNRSKGYTFNDVLITPAKSSMRSRKDPDLSSKLTKDIQLQLPFISANMDTITEWEMALAMDQAGGIGILHRFMDTKTQCEQIRKLKELGVTNLCASVGVNLDFKERTTQLVDAGMNIVTVDIAHGHSVAMLETLSWIKDNFPNLKVIAGNVATPEATIDLIEGGADAIKVGIGPGSMCTTRIITGCGVPQLTAIALCAEAASEKGIPVIADGGIKTSGDIVKAFAAGASTVMLGSILSGVLETPGEVRHGKKLYRGMASKSAQDSWRGGVAEGMAAEGESTYVPIKGHLREVVNELAGGLRSGMTYTNAQTLSEIKDNATFMEMSLSGYGESVAHGLGH